ncbi:MAG: hypothetical protein SWQ30_04505 [Thermodesulfobacteriota bacterium]|nr:hypothetical protein [Thermodesulfobacteriota bacterium]
MKRPPLGSIFLAILTIATLSGSVVHAQFHHVDDCPVCHYAGGAESSACANCANNAMIKCVINVPNLDPNGDPIPTDTTFGPYVTREEPYNGVCEVCHAETKYYQNNPDGNHDHCFEKPCVSCHKHSYEFSHGGDSCGDMGCHDGSSGPHATHVTINSRGPETALTCNDCHPEMSSLEIGEPILMADGDPLETTTVCNDCHSAGGAYDGLKDDANGSIGAKDHWHWVDARGKEREGVYEVVPDWLGDTAYRAYDLVKHEGTVYQRDNDGTSGGSFNGANWTGIGPFADVWYGRWHRGTEYKTGDVVEYDGDAYRSLAEFTSGAAFNAVNWELMGPPYVSRYAWQSYHSYLLDDEVRYDHNAYRATDSFVSVDVFNPDNWELIGPQYDSRFIKWKPSKTYYPDDVVQCNYGRSYRCIAAGEFVSGENFDDSKWRRIWGNETLAPGKGKWCAGCHDGGTSAVGSMAAPSVIGDGSNYGYYVSGHGRLSANLTCEVCHDATIRHIVSFNGRQRTYGALAVVKPAKFYQNAYRLNRQMVIPRPDTQVDNDTFRPCTDCHDYSKLISFQSNFRDRGLFAHHQVHLESVVNCWDSDWNADPLDPDNYKETQSGGPIDSHLSCPACHNVHGSPTPAMTRHGELISTPGTTEKVPALDFKWLDLLFAETDVLDQSRYGWLKAGPVESGPMKNHICTNCHREDAEYTEDGNGERYERCPKGEESIVLLKVWTSDDVPDVDGDYDKTVFYPEDEIYYNARFQIFGCGHPDGVPYLVESVTSKAKCRRPYPETCEAGDDGFWQEELERTDSLPAGTYVWTWNETLPADPVLGDDSAKLVIRLEYHHSGGVNIPESTHLFSVVEPPPE